MASLTVPDCEIREHVIYVLVISFRKYRIERLERVANIEVLERVDRMGIGVDRTRCHLNVAAWTRRYMAVLADLDTVTTPAAAVVEATGERIVADVALGCINGCISTLEVVSNNHAAAQVKCHTCCSENDILFANHQFWRHVDMLKHSAKNAAAIVCVGTCAAFGGIPHAYPNPTGAVSVSDIITDKPIINVSGCPPIPVVITGVLAHFLTFGSIPELDHLGRPAAYYGQSIHDRCYRRPFYERGKFAKTFDDEGAKKGWCLYELGCKGPTTYNACATVKWNGGTSFPIGSGHGCIGCSEPNFWDKGGFYNPISAGDWGSREALMGAAAAGTALGIGSALSSRSRKKKAQEAEEATTS